MVVVTVLGLGTLGGNIAGELAYCGHSVRVWDKDEESMNALTLKLGYEKESMRKEGLLLHGDFLGEIFCFSSMGEALTQAELVIEAVSEELDVKKSLMKEVSLQVKPKTILATSSLRLSIDDIFSKAAYKERCIGLRFLYPVYCIPEVELRTGNFTNIAALEYCTTFLERMGKTGFYRSGSEPLILTEEDREVRRVWRKQAVIQNRGLSGKKKFLIPKLAHSGNFAPPQDDTTVTSPSALDVECVICMDSKRTCVLSPCHHLCTCTDCGQMLVRRKDACPICRRNITDIVPFYKS